MLCLVLDPSSAPSFLDPMNQFETFSLMAHLSRVAFTNTTYAFILVFLTIYWVFYLPTLKDLKPLCRMMILFFRVTKYIILPNILTTKQPYFLVIFYLFLIILVANLVGLVPYSFTVTSCFIFTLFLSLSHFIAINIIASENSGSEFANQIWPDDAPIWIALFLVPVETISYFARIFSLSIRLFANMMAGHALLKILTGFVWLMFDSTLAVIAIVPWGIVTAVSFLELLIAGLQAYVFVVLLSVYLAEVLHPIKTC